MVFDVKAKLSKQKHPNKLVISGGTSKRKMELLLKLREWTNETKKLT